MLLKGVKMLEHWTVKMTLLNQVFQWSTCEKEIQVLTLIKTVLCFRGN